MTKLFATRSALVATMTMLATPAISAQQDDEAPPPSKPGKPISAGEVLSGELNAMKVRDVKNAGKRIAMYQITPSRAACRRRTGCAISRPARRPSSSSPAATRRPRS